MRFFTLLVSTFLLSLSSGSPASDTVTYAVLRATVSSQPPPSADRSSGESSESLGPQRRKFRGPGTESLPDDDGVYAAFSSLSSFSGRLIKANPFNACHPLRLRLPHFNKVVLLVEYGGCNYTRKTRNVRFANARAMILKNKDDKLMRMESERTWLNFVAVMVDKTFGATLQSCLDEGKTVNVTINVGKTERKEAYGLINEKAFTVICVAFGFVIVLSMFGLSFFYVQRCRIVGAERRRQKRLKRKAEKAVNRLPTRVCKGRSLRGSRISTYNDSSSTSSGTEACVICLDDFCQGDLLTTLPCNHEFHKVCIDPWLLDKRTCPMCKLDIVKILAVRNTEVTEANNTQMEHRFSSPLRTSFSRVIIHESEPVELRSARSASELQDGEHSAVNNEGSSNESTSESVTTTVHVTELSNADNECVAKGDLAHATFIDIEGKLSNDSYDKSGSVWETNELSSISAHSLTSQTSEHRSERQYDSRDCLI